MQNLAFIRLIVFSGSGLLIWMASSSCASAEEKRLIDPVETPGAIQTPGQISSPDDMATVLDRLEAAYRVVSIPGDSHSKRLSNLELKVFGCVKSGSLVERLAQLQAKDATPDQVDGSRTGKPDSNSTPQSTSSQINQSSGQASDQAQANTAYGAAAERIRKRLALLPAENAQFPMYFRIEPPGTKEDGDYISDILQATKHKVLRFKGMPIPVYITPFQNGSYTKACVEGFENWEARTDGLVRFVQVADPKEARIKVIWNKLGMSTDQNNCALGAHTVTKWQKNNAGRVGFLSMGAIPVPVYIPKIGPRYQVQPQIIEVNLDLIESKIPEFRFVLLKNIVTHELGHALGLLGHSQNRGDMMFAITDENSRISERDVNTLKRLYHMRISIPL